MQILEHGRHLRGIKLAFRFLKFAYAPQVRKHLTSTDKFQHELELPGVLTEAVKSDHVRVVRYTQDLGFVGYMIHLLHLHQVMFLQALDSHII